MFAATYLVWQSWLFASDDAALLVDPLLVDNIGRGDEHTRNRLFFWPPREFDWGALPPIDAVAITHEHDDHFNLPSLARIDRRIPIYLSDRSTDGARTVLREMGFEVRPLAPSAPLQFGSLQLRTFRPDHTHANQMDEWDTQAFLVRHAGGEGHFYTPVDVTTEQATRDELLALQAAEAPNLISFERMTVGHWGPDEQIEHNHHRPASADRLAFGEQALGKVRAGERVALLPGYTLVWQKGQLSDVRDHAPFLRTPPRDQWPPRPRIGIPEGSPLVPCCGERSVDEQGWAELEAGLDELAAYLYGREHFRALLSLDERYLEGRKPALVMLFLNNPTPRGYEYDISGRCFRRVRVKTNIQDAYAGSFGCWATDFVALLRGDFDPRSIEPGVTEQWVDHLEAPSFFKYVVWPFFHPLNRPGPCLRQYRVAAGREAQAPILVRPRR